MRGLGVANATKEEAAIFLDFEFHIDPTSRFPEFSVSAPHFSEFIFFNKPTSTTFITYIIPDLLEVKWVARNIKIKTGKLPILYRFSLPKGGHFHPLMYQVLTTKDISYLCEEFIFKNIYIQLRLDFFGHNNFEDPYIQVQ